MIGWEDGWVEGPSRLCGWARVDGRLANGWKELWMNAGVWTGGRLGRRMVAETFPVLKL